MMRYNEYVKLVDSCRKFNYDSPARKEQELIDSLGRVAFAKEYQTVSIEVGRRCGKSTYVVNNAKPWDLVITQNPNMVARLNSLGTVATVMYIPEFLSLYVVSTPQPMITMRPRTIFLDSCFNLATNELDAIYNVLAFDVDQQFVILN